MCIDGCSLESPVKMNFYSLIYAKVHRIDNNRPRKTMIPGLGQPQAPRAGFVDEAQIEPLTRSKYSIYLNYFSFL